MMLGNRSLIPPSPRAGQQKLPSLHLPAIGARRPADTPRKKAAKRSSSNSSSSSSSSENDVPSQPAHEEHFLPTISTSVNRLGVPPVDYVSTRHNPMEVGVSGSSRRTSVSRASSRMFSARPSPAMSARKAATDAGSESQFPSPRRCGVQPYKNAWSITYLLKDGSVRERVSLQPPQLVRPADAPRGRCEWKNKLMTNYQRPTYDNIMRTINCDASQRGYHLRHVMYLDNDFAQFCVLTPNSSLCCISWLFQVIVDLGTSPRWGEAEFMYSTTPREEDVPRDHQKQQHEVPQHEEFLEDCTAAAEDESYGEVPVVDVDDVRQTRSYMTPPSPLRESEYSKESRSNRASPQQEEEIEDISPQPEMDEVSTARKEAVVDEVADVPAEESTARAGRKEEEEEEVPVYDDVSVVSDHANADHFDDEQPPMSEREEDQLSYVPADVEEEDGDADEEDAAILMEPARSPSPPAECVSPPIQVDEDDDTERDDVVVEDDLMNEEPSPAEHQFGVVTDLASYNQSETGALMEVGEEYAESIAPEQAAVENICLDMYEYLPSPVEQHRGTTLNLPLGSLTDVDDVKQVDEEHTEFAAADPAEVDDVHPDYEGAMDVGEEDVLPNEDAFAGAKVLAVPSPAEVMRGDVNDLGSQTSYQNAEMDMGEEDVPSMAGDAAAVDDICHDFLAQHRSPAECERGVTRAMDSQCSDSEEAMDVGEEDVPSDEDAFAGAKVLVVPSPAEVMRGDVNDLGSQTSYQNAEMDMGEEDVPSMAGDAAAVDDICHDFLAQQHRSPAECERGVTRAMDSQCSDSEEAMDVGEEDVPSDEDAFASARVLVVPSPTEMAAGATNVMGSQGSWQRRLLELGEEDVPSCGVGEEVSQRGCSQTSFVSEEAEGNVSPVARHNQHMARSPRRYSGSLYASSHEPID